MKLEKAHIFAKEAHKGQLRKYTGEEYIVHPRNVLELLLTHAYGGVGVNTMCAALLHDTVEDTEVTIEEIEMEFGAEVAMLVSDLTDPSKPEDGNRKTRKSIDLEHTAKAHSKAKDIKIADLIDNTYSIVKYDPNFAVVFMKEKQKLLEVLKEGNPYLLNIANRLVVEYYLNKLEG